VQPVHGQEYAEGPVDQGESKGKERILSPERLRRSKDIEEPQRGIARYATGRHQAGDYKHLAVIPGSGPAA
jgi:hypothetical protein